MEDSIFFFGGRWTQSDLKKAQRSDGVISHVLLRKIACKSDLVVHACKPSMSEIEVKGPLVPIWFETKTQRQGHIDLCDYKASVDCKVSSGQQSYEKRLRLKNNKQKVKARIC